MLADDINDEIESVRKGVDDDDEPAAEFEETDLRQMPSAGVMLGVGMAIVGLGVLGWMIYRRRQQSRNLVRQLAGRLPIAFDDLRDELRSQLRRVRSR